MKLYSILSAVVLGMAVHVHAQNNPVPSSPKAASVAKDPNMNADGSVTLSAGVLKEVVAEIERRIGHWTPSKGGEQLAMPNLMYANDAYNAEVPGDLRLRGVSPLQAVAFAAAAAGCALVPIFAPKEIPDAVSADSPRFLRENHSETLESRCCGPTLKGKLNFTRGCGWIRGAWTSGGKSASPVSELERQRACDNRENIA